MSRKICNFLFPVKKLQRLWKEKENQFGIVVQQNIAFLTFFLYKRCLIGSIDIVSAYS